MYCRQCGKKLLEKETTCSSCHAKVGKGNRYCYNCGAKDAHTGDFCESCGAKLNISASELSLLQQSSNVSSYNQATKASGVEQKQSEPKPTFLRKESSNVTPTANSGSNFNKVPGNDSVVSPAIQKLMATGKRSDIKVSMYSSYGNEDNPLASTKDNDLEDYFKPNTSNKDIESSNTTKQNINTSLISDKIANAIQRDDRLDSSPAVKQEPLSEENDLSNDTPDSKVHPFNKEELSLFGIAAMLLSMGFVITNSVVFLITGFVCSVIAILRKDFKISIATLIMLSITAINTFVMPIFF